MKELILPSSNVKETLDKYPFLKETLISLSPKFKRLLNPVLYKTLAAKVTFRQAADVAGVSLCELLHALNRKLGLEEELYKMAGECLEGGEEETVEVPPELKDEEVGTLLSELSEHTKGSLEVTIQSATPVAYPILIALLTNEDFRANFKVKEVKVWRETEKHLSWIISGKADITFTSVLVMPRMLRRDLYMIALLVWDNFSIISRTLKDLRELVGSELHLPLFEQAPPAKITRYVLRRIGIESSQVTFVFGNPFGRPERIAESMLKEEIEHAVLREPELSFLISEMNKRGMRYYLYPFSDLVPNFHFPNAGLVVKGDFLKRYPREVELISKLIEEEVRRIRAGEVNISDLLARVMGVDVNAASLFLQRVKLEYVSGEQMRNEVKEFFSLLRKLEIEDISDERMEALLGKFLSTGQLIVS